MATIGNLTAGGFFEAFGGVLQTLAQKFTSPSTFTPERFYISTYEGWGVGGTLYVAIYSDNTGSPETKLWDSSVSYTALSNTLREVTITDGPELSASTDYWLCAYAKNSSGSFLVGAGSTTSIDGQQMKTWTESVEGSWTNSPSISNDGTAGETMVIYATNDATTTSSSSSTSTTSSSSSTSTTSTLTTTSTSSTSSSSSTSTTSSSSTSTTSTSSSTSSTSSSSTSTTSTSSSTSSTSISTSTTSTPISTSTTTTLIPPTTTSTTSTSTSSTSTSSTSSSSSSSTSSTSSSSTSTSSTSTSSTSSSSSTSSTSTSVSTSTSTTTIMYKGLLDLIYDQRPGFGEVSYI